MPGKDAFSQYHPLVNFLFFGIVFTFPMLCMHPVCLAAGFSASACYAVTINRTKGAGFLIKRILPLVLLTALINPAFSHAGQTILCYLPTGNPLTLESILYGISAGVLLGEILMWFFCFSEVVTADKFMYLFGKMIPALSLLISMTLRFVPQFQKRFHTVREAQSLLGRDTGNGGFLKRTKNAVVCFSIVVTWSLENAVETADSMKSRGYGTQRRTAYSIYRLSGRDKTAAAFLLFCGVFLLAGGVAGKFFWRYYPSVRGVPAEPLTLTLQAAYAVLCFMPVILDRKEEKMWKCFRSTL